MNLFECNEPAYPLNLIDLNDFDMHSSIYPMVTIVIGEEKAQQLTQNEILHHWVCNVGHTQIFGDYQKPIPENTIMKNDMSVVEMFLKDFDENHLKISKKRTKYLQQG